MKTDTGFSQRLDGERLGKQPFIPACPTDSLRLPQQEIQVKFCPEWKDHDFKEEYYGYQCSKCDMFFAYGMAPWEDE